MSVRLRRLKADYEKMCSLFSGNSRIKVVKTLGNPAEKYQIEFLVTSLQHNLQTQKLKTHNNFMVEIVLTGSYPRLAPQCRMLTPVFHPNIAPHAICIGDHWAAGESLSNLVVRIAEMLAFQSYNLKSPLNGEAARWVEQHQARLPLDTFDFVSLLSVGEAVGLNREGSRGVSGVCANCGKSSSQISQPMEVCVNNHLTCHQCRLVCPICDNILCLACNLKTCSICGRSVCQKCIMKCHNCGQFFCADHSGACHVCGQGHCINCMINCQKCGRPTCINHLQKVKVRGEKAYWCTSCVGKATIKKK